MPPTMSEADRLRDISVRSNFCIGIRYDEVTDTDAIEYFDQGAVSLFGYTEAEALGQSSDILIPAALRTAHRGHIRAFSLSQVTERAMGGDLQRLQGMHKDGSLFDVEITISKIESLLVASGLKVLADGKVPEARGREVRMDVIRLNQEMQSLKGMHTDYETRIAALEALPGMTPKPIALPGWFCNNAPGNGSKNMTRGELGHGTFHTNEFDCDVVLVQLGIDIGGGLTSGSLALEYQLNNSAWTEITRIDTVGATAARHVPSPPLTWLEGDRIEFRVRGTNYAPTTAEAQAWTWVILK